MGPTPRRRRGALTPQGPDFGPLRSRASVASPRDRSKVDVELLLCELPGEVMETLQILVEIELSRHDLQG